MATVAVGSRAVTVGKYDRLFYSAMAITLGATVVAGFSRTYYLRFFDGGPTATLSGGPFTPLVYVHGALFTAWIVLFVVQTALIASHRVAVHRRLGIAGAALAAAMLVAGTLTAIATAARGSAPVGVDPLSFLAIPIFDMVLFATFVTAALVRRRDKETHKRLMLLAVLFDHHGGAGAPPWRLTARATGVLRADVPLPGGGRDSMTSSRGATCIGLRVGRGTPRALGTSAPGHFRHRRLARVRGVVDQMKSETEKAMRPWLRVC